MGNNCKTVGAAARVDTPTTNGWRRYARTEQLHDAWHRWTQQLERGTHRRRTNGNVWRCCARVRNDYNAVGATGHKH
eukprot:3218901-Lingulodinium_polyedra.AAC.1